jgi:hydrogenase nickel incorporation protein HypB
MCATCGCGDHAHDHDHPHEHPDSHDHDHMHAHPHDHSHPHSHGQQGRAGRNLIELEASILAKNDALADKNRAWFAGREILAVNLLGGPGAGKTTLLERTIAALEGELPLFVIEGDQATANDAERVRAAGAAVFQVNTGTGCHLDAVMVAKGLAQLRPPPGAALIIENVGNLVCPALFDLGERAKVVIYSVTEGEDKPVKYPHMFRAADLVILNKIDLVPYLDFDLARAIAELRRVNPSAPLLQLSARTGAGLAPWCEWLRAQFAAARGAVFA